MRLLLVSGGIMMLGLIAVFAAIVYKLNESGSASRPPAARLSAEAPVDGSISIPPGYRLIGTALDGERALLSLEAPDGASTLMVIDLATGAELSRHRLVEE